MGFGSNLRNIRENRGLTQQQVADMMEIDKSTYCGYETGKRQPDVQKLKKLAKIFGISGDELLETGYDEAPAKISNGERSEDAILYSAYKSAPENVQEAIRNLLKLK